VLGHIDVKFVFHVILTITVYQIKGVISHITKSRLPGCGRY